MRGHRHRSVSPNVRDDRVRRGGEHGRRGGTAAPSGDGARGRDRAAPPNGFVRNHTSRAHHVRRRAPAARVRRARRLPPLLRRPARHVPDLAQGRARRRPHGGAVGRRQPPVRPGLRPLDPLQHHHRCRGSASSATSSPRLERLAEDARRQAGATLRHGPVRRRHRMVDAAVRRQLAAVGADRRRRPRVGDVPAQRARASSSPGSRWRWSASPRSGSSPPSPSTTRCGRRSTGPSCGSAPPSARWCSG